MRVRQHIPAFVSGIEPWDGEVHTLAELLDLPFVRDWATDERLKGFSYSPYPITLDGESRDLLMAETTDGKWYVVASVWPMGTLAPFLPAWVSPP